MKEVQQRVPGVDEVNRRIAAWRDENPDEWQMARGLFDMLVMPQERYVKYVGTFFSEWMLWCFRLSGQTIADEWADEDPSLADWSKATYSRYEVLSIDADAGCATLRDVFSGEAVEVHDEWLCEHPNWTEGTLGTRLACVGGSWLHVGCANLHDGLPFDPAVYTGPGAMLGDLYLVIGGGNAEVKAVSSVTA